MTADVAVWREVAAIILSTLTLIPIIAVCIRGAIKEMKC